MARWIVLLLALPVLDLYLLGRLRAVVGGSHLLFAVLASAFLGVAIARAVGAREVRAWREALATGRPADRNVLDSVLLWLGCGGLIVPGFITDVLGLLLLLRPVRRALSAHLTRAVRAAAERGALHVVVESPVGVRGMRNADWSSPATGPAVIDVEGEVVEPSEVSAPRRLSPTLER